MIPANDPRTARLIEDWAAHDPGQHPTPQDLLCSPTPFVAWLRRTPARRFRRPSDPFHCPLASFVRGESRKGWASVDGTLVLWEPPENWLPMRDGRQQMALPGWARCFIHLWDAWCALRSAALCSFCIWGAYPSAREARAVAWLCTFSPRRVLRGLRHGQEVIP